MHKALARPCELSPQDLLTIVKLLAQLDWLVKLVIRGVLELHRYSCKGGCRIAKLLRCGG